MEEDTLSQSTAPTHIHASMNPKPGKVHVLVTPVLRRREQKETGSLPSQPRLISVVQVPVRDCVSGEKKGDNSQGRTPEVDLSFHMHTCTHTFTHMYTHIHICNMKRNHQGKLPAPQSRQESCV